MVYALNMVASFCSIRERNCFQPIDLENRLLLVRCKRSFAYRLGRFLFRMATSKSSSVTCPSPSLSNSSKNRFPYINKCQSITLSSCHKLMISNYCANKFQAFHIVATTVQLLCNTSSLIWTILLLLIMSIFPKSKISEDKERKSSTQDCIYILVSEFVHTGYRNILSRQDDNPRSDINFFVNNTITQ